MHLSALYANFCFLCCAVWDGQSDIYDRAPDPLHTASDHGMVPNVQAACLFQQAADVSAPRQYHHCRQWVVGNLGLPAASAPYGGLGVHYATVRLASGGLGEGSVGVQEVALLLAPDEVLGPRYACAAGTQLSASWCWGNSAVSQGLLHAHTDTAKATGQHDSPIY